MGRQRVLVIENSLDLTGALNSILRSCDLMKEQFDFCFLLPTGSKSGKYVLQRGYQVFELPMKEIRKEAWSIFIYVPFLILNTIRLRKLMQSISIDLIISNDFYNMLAPFYKSIGGNIPYVCYVRFLPQKFPGFLVYCWCWLHDRYAKRIISVSQAVKKELFNKRKVIVVSNEFPGEQIELTESHSHTILYPANYIEGKGHFYALRCFAALHPNYGNWKLRFVGGDMGLFKNMEYKRKLIAQSTEMGLLGFVEWNGFSEHMSNEYTQSSIVLNFSESESFSLTCLEAMYYGRALIATRSGGPQEIIVNEKNGLLVNLGDVSSMVNALKELMDKPEKRNSLAAQAYRDVRIQFDPQKIKNLLVGVYSGALDSKQS